MTNTGTDYELLTERLMQLISARSPGLITTRLERHQTLVGRSGPSVIDVVWEFEAKDGPHRVIFECRDYASPLKRQAVHSWRSIVDDLSSLSLPTMGVMITKTGFQSGAQQVAGTYGVVIIQMRQPTSADLAGRLTQIVVTGVARTPYIDPSVPVSFAASEILRPHPEDAGPGERVSSDRYSVESNDGPAVPLTKLLVAEVVRPFGDAEVPSKEVRLVFDPPATLHLDGIPIAKITAVTGAAGEAVSTQPTFTIGSRESLAYLMKNVLDGTAVWFTDTDSLRVTNDIDGYPLTVSEVVRGRTRDL